MSNKMLVDATHPEETRVVVLRGNRVDEFDHESLSRRQLRGNIYLAKVTRVEPSLQAAFVDFGGNRHGFLAFSEIHPDYYQIPVADRQALLEEEAEEASRAAEEEAANDDSESSEIATPTPAGQTGSVESDDQDAAPDTDNSSDTIALASHDAGPRITGETDRPETSDEEKEPSDNAVETASELTGGTQDKVEPETGDGGATTSPDENGVEPLEDQPQGPELEAADANGEDDESAGEPDDQESSDNIAEALSSDDPAADAVESVGSEDVMEEVPHRVRKRHRTYKIQEVIKRRQIILVQVVKEERGNKGAALTTYLSLAGRYTVLMPNTARGGGISRKITNHNDRRRLRKIANELEVPLGTGLIIRTAGASRTKAEIKRDFEYLLRLWENVRDLTLQSTAPSLVYEEGSLIKRSIRDLYSKEIDEILVAGDEAYREAKDFMRMLMPSHAKNVQPYKEPDPLFIRHRIERQLNSMFSPYVTLKSGGYVVINQTEALVAIDVNSGKATREHSIEETALKTNMEAADEIARQLRLRDLAGLIVIDFIDMDEKRNNRAVERRIKDCLRNDRARIQIGRISHFGLLEMSRQRLRPGVLEGSTTSCPHCGGTGAIRSTESVSLSILRALEDSLINNPDTNLSVTASIEVALYILNQKRPYLKDIEARYDTTIAVNTDENLHGANFTIERISRDDGDGNVTSTVVQMDWAHHEPHADTKNDSDKRRGRRRRGRGRNGQEDDTRDKKEVEARETNETSDDSDDTNARRDGGRRGRKRGRRGGRRNRSNRDNAIAKDADNQQSDTISDEHASDPDAHQQQAAEASGEALSSDDHTETTDATVSDSQNLDPESVASEQSTQAQSTDKPKKRKVRSKEKSKDKDKDKDKPRRRSRKSAKDKESTDDIEAAAAQSDKTDDAAKTNGNNGGENGHDGKHDQGEMETKSASKDTSPPTQTPPAEQTVSDEPPAKTKRGWWQRRI